MGVKGISWYSRWIFFSIRGFQGVVKIIDIFGIGNEGL